jgi:predicted RNase H-like nuclease/uncharacterized protein (DUF433 family)
MPSIRAALRSWSSKTGRPLQARAIIEDAKRGADYILIAIDQPTLVPNQGGCRPVERVAGSLINRLKGGVQPANRGKVQMFGDTAPIWSFLESLNARENPEAARHCESGDFLIEVFPALALPAMVDAIPARGRAAKYNPAIKAQFSCDDWLMVATSVADHASRLRMPKLAAWARAAGTKSSPTKTDQDLLDAAICLIIAVWWRHGDGDEMAVLGDNTTGYIVTPVSKATRSILEASASKNGVGFNLIWSSDAVRSHISLATSPSSTDSPLKRITRERGKLGGKPCIRGMRIGVSHVLEMLASGMTPDEILDTMSYLEADDIRAACAYGAMLAEKDRLT